MADKYHRVSHGEYHPRVRPKGVAVTNDGNEAIFRCPCGKRDITIKRPPHGIEFDDSGVLTIEGSIGGTDIRNNVCHFNIKGGEVHMHADSRCRGMTDG